MIQPLLMVLLFFLSFLWIDNVFQKKEVTKYQKRNNQLIFVNDFDFKTILKKFYFLKSKDEFLFRLGYPLKLNAISYYVCKFMLTILCFLSSKMNYDSILATTIFSFIGWFLLDGYLYLYQRSRDASVCAYLLNVVNSISLQLSANITLKDSLKKQFEICQNKDLKQAMLKFSTKYELSKLDLEDALKELKNSFQIVEMDMFCNTLSQYFKVTNMLEVLEHLSEALEEKQLRKIRDKTRSKILYITCGVVLALGNMILLTFYPLFVSLGNNFNTIFN